MNKFYLLIVGSRFYSDYNEFVNITEYVLKNRKEEIVIVSGGALGADYLAKKYANDNKYEYIEFRADWNKYNKSAGYIRNKQMHQFISEKSNRGCLAFWDGKSKGTSHSFKLAKEYNNPIRIYNFTEKIFMTGV